VALFLFPGVTSSRRIEHSRVGGVFGCGVLLWGFCFVGGGLCGGCLVLFMGCFGVSNGLDQVEVNAVLISGKIKKN